MENSKKIKLYIGLFYLFFIGLFIYYLLSKFSLEEITSYDFIKNNRDYFFELRQTNLFLLATIFFLFIIIWVLAAGFGSPIAIFGGFIFGKWLGSIIVALGLSMGASLLYLFANYFFAFYSNVEEMNKLLRVFFACWSIISLYLNKWPKK